MKLKKIGNFIGIVIGTIYIAAVLYLDNSDNKLKIINTFSKAINDLKKLEE